MCVCVCVCVCVYVYVCVHVCVRVCERNSVNLEMTLQLQTKLACVKKFVQKKTFANELVITIVNHNSRTLFKFFLNNLSVNKFESNFGNTAKIIPTRFLFMFTTNAYGPVKNMAGMPCSSW